MPSTALHLNLNPLLFSPTLLKWKAGKYFWILAMSSMNSEECLNYATTNYAIKEEYTFDIHIWK